MTRPYGSKLRIGRRLFVTASAAAIAMPAMLGNAQAQEFPNRPITLVVSFAPGGGTDLMARLVAPAAAEILGQPIVIQNVAGAEGKIAAETIMRAEPDGYSLLICTVGAAIILPHLLNDSSYDPLAGLKPITALTTSTIVMTAGPNMPANNLEEFIALAKERPGELTYGTSGIGSPPHLAAELLQQMAGIELTHIPYTGSGPSLLAAISGEVDVTFSSTVPAKQHIENGTLRAFALASPERSPSFPDLPTVAESGYPGYEMTTWLGVFAPAGTPDAIVQQIRDAFVEALYSENVQEYVRADGSTNLGLTPEEFAEMLEREDARIGSLIDNMNL